MGIRYSKTKSLPKSGKGKYKIKRIATLRNGSSNSYITRCSLVRPSPNDNVSGDDDAVDDDVDDDEEDCIEFDLEEDSDYQDFNDEVYFENVDINPYNLNGNKEELKRLVEGENIEDRDNDDLYDTLPADSVEASFQVCPPCTLSRCPNPNLFDSSESYRDKQLSSLYLFDDNVMYNSTSPIKMQSNGQKIKKHSETLEAGSEANVPRMVEAFRPLIEDSVRVSELLPYLHFLENKEEILAKERESPKRAAGLLLDHIIASGELGKWTTFVDALKTVGYQYITNILLGHTELDLSTHRNILKIFIPEIINDLEPSELTDRLYARDVISLIDKEEIECELRNRGPSAASLKLLDRIPRRIQNWYCEFVDALRACGFDFVANRIDLPELKECTTSLSGETFQKSSYTCDLTSAREATVTTEAKKTDEDEWYITPKDSASFLPTKRDSNAPPIPKRPELYYNNTTTTPEDSPKLTSKKIEKKLSIRTSTLVEFLNEKKRLIIEQEDIKEKRRVSREIKILQRQNEISAIDESDDDLSVHVGLPSDKAVQVKEEDIAFHGKVTKDNAMQKEQEDVTVTGPIANDKVIQVEQGVDSLNISFLANHSDRKAIPAEDKEALDSQLSNISLKDFLNLIKDLELYGIKIPIRRETSSTDTPEHISIDEAIRAPAKEFSLRDFFNSINIDISSEGKSKPLRRDTDCTDTTEYFIENDLPKAHAKLKRERIDSGMYSATDIYLNAPVDYV